MVGLSSLAVRTNLPEKVLRIVGDIDTKGSVPPTRLKVLEAWLEQPGRSASLGLWIARKAAGRKGKTKGVFGALLDEARTYLGTTSTRDSYLVPLDRQMLRDLHDRARDAQNEFQEQPSGPVRVIQCWPLLLVEKGIALHLADGASPNEGYRLVADWAQNHDARFGIGLNGPSRGKLTELVRFLFAIEALEDESR